MWYQLHIENCLRDLVDELSDLLENAGALSVTLSDQHDDAILEPELGTTPLWPYVDLCALFEDESIAHNALSVCQHLYPSLLMTMSTLADQDWETVCKDDFKSEQIGQRLWICPSWDLPPKEAATTVLLDPGLAFGTGKHPTTRLCLEWLDQAPLENKSIIDYGCGSGILAIAALKLGVSAAYAADIDPHALQATENNAKDNSITPTQLQIDYPDKLCVAVDILMANILLGPLISLQDSFLKLLKKDGLLVVSGILSEQTDSLLLAYQDQFKHLKTETKEDWALMVFCPR